jgi:aspartyl-tRNA(Asn)/glutamyl-tRNA(Gln) amidotransferase subunit B
LALNCEIPKIAKFDRKHYFYPDLPKGYQISQYDEPFARQGELKVKGQNEKGKTEEEAIIRINRVHLEEDAGKLVHSDGKSLVDLNRAGTPLMEIVTEPDIASPEEAGAFLRQLQKIVRDVVKVSEASMEKGHLRCDANISVSDQSGNMSPIIELKNINSFRFVEKALALVEEKLKKEYSEWPEKNSKETWGYNSKENKIYLQRRKEEAADYRYFPEPDLPPINTGEFDLENIQSEVGETAEEKMEKLIQAGLPPMEARALAANELKTRLYDAMLNFSGEKLEIAKLLVHSKVSFNASDLEKAKEYARIIDEYKSGKITRNIFIECVNNIHEGKDIKDLSEAGISENELETIVENIVAKNPGELEAYKNGKGALFGFFMGQIMRETGGKADPQIASRILKEKLGK